MLLQLFRDSNEVMQHICAATCYILQRISSNNITSYNNSTDRPGQSGVTCQEWKIPSSRAASTAGHLVLSWDRPDRDMPHGPVVCPGTGLCLANVQRCFHRHCDSQSLRRSLCPRCREVEVFGGFRLQPSTVSNHNPAAYAATPH